MAKSAPAAGTEGNLAASVELDGRAAILAAAALVAQLDRASDFESEGREFESLRARQKPQADQELIGQRHDRAQAYRFLVRTSSAKSYDRRMENWRRRVATHEAGHAVAAIA